MIVAWKINKRYFAKLSSGKEIKGKHWILQAVDDMTKWDFYKMELNSELVYMLKKAQKDPCFSFKLYLEALRVTHGMVDDNPEISEQRFKPVLDRFLKFYCEESPFFTKHQWHNKKVIPIKEYKDRKEFMRKWMKEQHDKVTDFAVRQSLRGTKFFLETGIKLTKENTPKEIIEARREQILMKRKLKQLKGEMHG